MGKLLCIIEELLTVVPPSETELIKGLNSLIRIASCSSPSLVELRWAQLGELVSTIGEADDDWKKAALEIWLS